MSNLVLERESARRMSVGFDSALVILLRLGDFEEDVALLLPE